MAEFDIKQVTRYVLVRKFQGKSDIFLHDFAEFKRRDEAESLLVSLKAMSPEDAAEEAESRGWVYNSPALAFTNDDGSVSLVGHNGKDIFSLSPGEAIKNIGGKLVHVPSA